MAAEKEGAKAARYIANILALAGSRGIPTAGLNFGPARQSNREFVVTPNQNPLRPVNLGAAVDLAKEMVEEPVDFDAGVVFVPGVKQGNAGFVDTPENREAFIRQTPEEHREALEQFLNNPHIPPDKATQLGKKAEEGLAKWWNDHNPRRPVTPTSSAVKKARIGANGDIYITFASGNKEYQYEGSSNPVEASRILADLVAKPESIGKRVNSWSGDWGKAHTYLPK